MRATGFLHHHAYAVPPPIEAPAKSVILGILFTSLHGSIQDELKLQHQQQHKAESEKLIETQLRWERYFLTIFITGSLFFKEPWCSSQCTYLAELVAPHNLNVSSFSSHGFRGGREALKLDAECVTLQV